MPACITLSDTIVGASIGMASAAATASVKRHLASFDFQDAWCASWAARQYGRTSLRDTLSVGGDDQHCSARGGALELAVVASVLPAAQPTKPLSDDVIMTDDSIIREGSGRLNDHQDPHTGLHSERGGLPGEHPGRARNPVIKEHDMAWLEFEKPNLDRAEAFAHAFGFSTAQRTPEALQLRGTDPGAPCVLIRKGPRSRFLGPAFEAADSADGSGLRKPPAARPSNCRRAWAD
jgi:hypothetical protein